MGEGRGNILELFRKKGGLGFSFTYRFLSILFLLLGEVVLGVEERVG